MSTALAQSADVRRPMSSVRALLALFCVLTTAGFISLFGLAARTAETFAWTIEPPLTAAFLGSGYGAGFVLSLLSLRAGAWADVRVPYLTVLVFTWVTTFATFRHVDRMHFRTGGEGPVAEPAGWFWAAVYVVIPLAMAVLLVPQERRPGRDPARRIQLPGWLRALLAMEGVVMLVVGGSLLVAPTIAETLWPWALTPLTARVVAAWLLAFAFAAAVSQRVDDVARLRTGAVAYTVFGVLQLVSVVRFADQVRWQDTAAWVYVAVAAAVASTGAIGWWLARGGRQPVSAA